MTDPVPPPDPMPLTDAELLGTVVRESPDHHQAATWAHLLKEEVDAGRVAFPITTFDQLEPLFRRAPDLGLDVPSADLVPPGFFPVDDYVSFVQRVLAVIRLVHHVKRKTHIPKLPPTT